MGEVGEQGPAFHAEIGAYAAERGIDALLALGDLCVSAVEACNGAGGRARHFDAIEDLIAAARPAAQGRPAPGV